MWNLVPLHPSEDGFIDEILASDRSVSSRVVRQHGSDGLCQPAGLRRLILTGQQLAMRRFHPVLIHLRAWLSLLLLRQRTGNDRQGQKDREHENRLRGFHPKVLLKVDEFFGHRIPTHRGPTRPYSNQKMTISHKYNQI